MFDILGYWSSVTVLVILTLLIPLSVLRELSVLWVTKVTKGEQTATYIYFLKKIERKLCIRDSGYNLYELLFIFASAFSFLWSAVMVIGALKGAFTTIHAIDKVSLALAPYASWVLIAFLTYFCSTTVSTKLYELSKTINKLTTEKSDESK